MRLSRRRFLCYSTLVTSSLALTGMPLYAYNPAGSASDRDEVRRSYCGLCHSRCGILLHMRGGGVFESNANMLCPMEPEFCSPEMGSWPHSALLCKVEKWV